MAVVPTGQIVSDSSGGLVSRRARRRTRRKASDVRALLVKERSRQQPGPYRVEGGQRTLETGRNPRSGERYRVMFNEETGRFEHVYGHGPDARTVTIRKANPFTAQYAQEHPGIEVPDRPPRLDNRPPTRLGNRDPLTIGGVRYKRNRASSGGAVYRRDRRRKTRATWRPAGGGDEWRAA